MMELQEAIEGVKNPNDKYNLDMAAIRVVVLELLKRSEEKPLEKGKKK